MDIPLKKVLKLLDSPEADVRLAAVVVLGEVGARDAGVAEKMLALLGDAEETVRLATIKACGQLKVAKALPVLLDKVGHGGAEAAPAAAAAAQLGSKGIQALQDLMHAVAPGVRRYIASALTTSAAPGADAVGVSVLADKDSTVSSSASAAIIANIPKLTPERKHALTEDILALLSDRKKALPATSELPIVRVLVALQDPATAGALWERVLPPHLPEVRAAALQAVGSWITTPTKEQWKRLFQCATDPDFRVAAPALMILNRLPATEKMQADWVKLLYAPDGAARRLGVEKVGHMDSPEVAQGLMAQYHHSERAVRDTAREALQQTGHGRKTILTALMKADGADDTWQFARTAAGFKDEIPTALRDDLVTKACQYLEAHDHRADALLFLLHEISREALQEALLDRAVAYRKKKKYEAALQYLKVMAREAGIGFAIRLELALCGLKLSARELDPHARDADPCLRNFDSLIQQDAALLRKELEKAKFLDPAELFYVGFHFAEQHGPARDFGVDLLKLVVKSVPKGEIGKSAKNKLKQVGA